MNVENRRVTQFRTPIFELQISVVVSATAATTTAAAAAAAACAIWQHTHA
jgi:hypothetical protein